MGFVEAPDWPTRSDMEYPRYRDSRILMTTLRVTQRHRSDLPACGYFAHIADYGWLNIALPVTAGARITTGSDSDAPSLGMVLDRAGSARWRPRGSGTDQAGIGREPSS